MSTLTRGIVFDPRMYRGAATPPSTTLEDKSRYHNNGTITAATWVQLTSGLWVLSFNGTSSDVDLPITNSLVMDGTRSFTVCTWVNSTVLSGKMLTWGSDQLDIYFNGVKYACIANFAGAGLQSASGNTTPVAGRWYHLVGRYDGAILTLHENGVLQTNSWAGVDAVAVGMAEIHIGNRRGILDWFSGMVAPLITVYKIPLTDTDIWNIFQSERSLFGI